MNATRSQFAGMLLFGGMLMAPDLRADFPSFYSPGCKGNEEAERASKAVSGKCLAALDAGEQRQAVLVMKGQAVMLGVVAKGHAPVWGAALTHEPKNTTPGGALFVGGKKPSASTDDAHAFRFVFRDEYASTLKQGSGACGAGSEHYLTIARIVAGKPLIETRILIGSCLKPYELASEPKPVRIEGKHLLINWLTNGEKCSELRRYDLDAKDVSKPEERKKSNCQ